MPPFDPSAAAHPESGLFGLDDSPQEAAVQVLGVPFDATTSYRRGAAGGPAAILAASHQIDLFDLETGHPYPASIHLPPLAADVERWNREAAEQSRPVIAAGGLDHAPQLADSVERVNQLSAQLNDWVAAHTESALAAGQLPALVGGDHAVPFGAIQALARRHPGLGILHIDAHADLRPAYEGFAWSHASIFHNVLEHLGGVARVLQVGLRDLSEEEHRRIADDERLRAVFGPRWAAARLAGRDLAQVVRAELEHLPQEVYVSVDVDGLDPALCPHTGTPVPGGLVWDEAMLWLGELVRSGRTIVGLDLCEVAPAPGGQAGQGWDEIVGARLLYRLIGFALASRDGGLDGALGERTSGAS